MTRMIDVQNNDKRTHSRLGINITAKDRFMTFSQEWMCFITGIFFCSAVKLVPVELRADIVLSDLLIESLHVSLVFSWLSSHVFFVSWEVSLEHHCDGLALLVCECTFYKSICVSFVTSTRLPKIKIWNVFLRRRQLVYLSEYFEFFKWS